MICFYVFTETVFYFHTIQIYISVCPHIFHADKQKPMFML